MAYAGDVLEFTFGGYALYELFGEGVESALSRPRHVEGWISLCVVTREKFAISQTSLKSCEQPEGDRSFY
jgi:hypothetical protein